MWGWEPTTTTTYEYENGLLVRSVTTTEPEFDADQVAYLIAIQLYENDIGPHGYPMSEAMSEEANPNNYDGHWRYQGVGPFTDYAEKAKADAVDAYRAGFPKDSPPNMNGLIFRVAKKPYP